MRETVLMERKHPASSRVINQSANNIQSGNMLEAWAGTILKGCVPYTPMLPDLIHFCDKLCISSVEFSVDYPIVLSINGGRSYVY
jgi:hypothetical protein